MLTIGTISKITMYGEHRLGYVHQMFRCKKTNHISHPRVGLRPVMIHSHASTGGEIVADQLTVLLNGHKTHAIGEYIGVIQGGNGKCRFKFPWQICFPVQGILKIRIINLDFHTLHPDLVIGPGAGQKCLGYPAAILQHTSRQGIASGRRWRHYVAIHIPTRSQCCCQSIVDSLHQGSQSRFYHPMKLETLS